MALASVLFAASFVSAQSDDLASPTPVFNNEISGRIAPLDVGDPRQTRHFYTFNAGAGDLELTIEANNLDGEIDLFTATAMRPLAQVALYSGIGSNVSRTVFFRSDETIILRVQARSANDSDGAYHIRLGGTFAPSTLPQPEESARNAASTSTSSGAKPTQNGVRRVNSIGARIEEPKSETPAPERAETTPTPSATTTPKPAPAKTPPARNSTMRRTSAARRGATRGSAASGTTAPSGESGKTETGKTETKEATPTSGETARAEPAPAENTRTPTNASRARTNRTRGSRTNATGSESRTATAKSSTSGEIAPTANPPSSAAPATAMGLEAPGSRIVLELRDGTRIERAMSEVRRVAVEGRLVVIVLKNGRVERQPLANIQRMSIEP
jgi:hypothetical protein